MAQSAEPFGLFRRLFLKFFSVGFSVALRTNFYLSSAKRSLPQLRHPPLISHFAPAMLPAVTKHNLMARFNLRPRAHRGVRQFHPLSVHQIAAFPTTQLKFPIIFKYQG